MIRADAGDEVTMVLGVEDSYRWATAFSFGRGGAGEDNRSTVDCGFSSGVGRCINA